MWHIKRKRANTLCAPNCVCVCVFAVVHYHTSRNQLTPISFPQNIFDNFHFRDRADFKFGQQISISAVQNLIQQSKSKINSKSYAPINLMVITNKLNTTKCHCCLKMMNFFSRQPNSSNTNCIERRIYTKLAACFNFYSRKKNECEKKHQLKNKKERRSSRKWRSLLILSLMTFTYSWNERRRRRCITTDTTATTIKISNEKNWLPHSELIWAKRQNVNCWR